MLRVHPETIRRYAGHMIRDGTLVIDDDYIESVSGKKYWHEKTVDKFIKHSKSLHYADVTEHSPYNISSRVRSKKCFDDEEDSVDE